MRKMYLLLTPIFLGLMFASCKTKVPTEQISEVEKLRQRLVAATGSYTLFGHQDAMAYGIGWKGEYMQSDVKKVAGSFPALFGWEIGHIGDSVNIDNVPFDSIRAYVQRIHEMEGIVTISWHARSPLSGSSSWDVDTLVVEHILPGAAYHDAFKAKLDLVADFLNSLKTNDGVKIPIIFRPWHEMNGEWFWWGEGHRTHEQYKQLFRYTIDYLKNEKLVDNILVAYSPDRMFDTPEEYLNWYPGDEYVDIMGVDNYWDFTQNRLDLVVKRLEIVADVAAAHGKIPAFTETGNERLSTPNWYTSNLLHVLNASEKTRQMAYVMVWRNHDTTHFYAPYPEHPQADDFRAFVASDNIVLLNELLELEKNNKK